MCNSANFARLRGLAGRVTGIVDTILQITATVEPVIVDNRRSFLSTHFHLMLRFALFIALVLSCEAQAGGGRHIGGVSQDGDASAAELAQKRRMVLREALKQPVEDASLPARQLSAQQRAELRQTLRQQPLDLPQNTRLAP